MAENPASSRSRHLLPERRIARLTLVLGVPASAIVAVGFDLRAGAGVLAGTLLAWLNFRWLRQILDAVVQLSTAKPGEPRPRISVWLYVKMFGRYALIAVFAYVIVVRFSVPLLSILGGLCSLGAAAMAESIYEVATYKH